jgi:hypothetical protein
MDVRLVSSAAANPVLCKSPPQPNLRVQIEVMSSLGQYLLGYFADPCDRQWLRSPIAFRKGRDDRALEREEMGCNQYLRDLIPSELLN